MQSGNGAVNGAYYLAGPARTEGTGSIVPGANGGQLWPSGD